MKITFTRILFFIFLNLITCHIFADNNISNYMLPKNAVVKEFTQGDLQLLFTNQLYALNRYHDGDKLTWRNPLTGHSGYLIPLSTKIENGVLCRKMLIVNQTQDREGRGTFKFCRKDKIWHMYTL